MPAGPSLISTIDGVPAPWIVPPTGKGTSLDFCFSDSREKPWPGASPFGQASGQVPEDRRPGPRPDHALINNEIFEGLLGHPSRSSRSQVPFGNAVCEALLGVSRSRAAELPASRAQGDLGYERKAPSEPWAMGDLPSRIHPSGASLRRFIITESEADITSHAGLDSLAWR